MPQEQFVALTESPGLPASREQLARLYHRYRFARDFAVGKDVLEAACGAGLGLEFLSRQARSVVGGDIEPANVAIAQRSASPSNVSVEVMDALNTGLPDASFDLILLFEALYYLPEPERFAAEARRLLRPNGVVVICTVNPAWADFHPSPHAHAYLTGPQLQALLAPMFDSVSLYGAFPTASTGLLSRLTSILKRAAVSFNLIPGNLAARNRLKRLFFGPLTPIPESIPEDLAPYAPPSPVSADSLAEEWKILYAVGRRGV